MRNVLADTPMPSAEKVSALVVTGSKRSYISTAARPVRRDATYRSSSQVE